MMIQRAILIGVCAAMLTACATTEQAGGFGKAEPSGFLNDYSMLHPAANETEASLVYFTPDKTKFKSYTKILLEPVQVWRGEKSSAKNIDMEDANHLSQFLWSRVDEELRKDYTMVQQPGPGVLRVRIGITEAGKGIPVLDNVTAMHPGSLIVSKGKKALSGTESLVGKSSIEMEATDSQTGELLGAGVDRRGGGKYAWKSLNRWEDVEQAFTYWAKKIRWRACTMRGDAVCEKPGD
ncbi:DUF3313 domain-containing protein [Nitrosomonas sp. Nm34]|uniref:DUF3313 domain-containing protein n=1 Tax=Nitrosomonas sp. Nm34 TaxID=1881055 RepID=UPI0008E3B8C0|nr:DUF3313 domain-containing protein [Nitrosomonas sp. Nm34]SFI17469.1 Protein of unknown function [Nitrosomonas sp. Nm34]